MVKSVVMLFGARFDTLMLLLSMIRRKQLLQDSFCFLFGHFRDFVFAAIKETKSESELSINNSEALSFLATVYS